MPDVTLQQPHQGAMPIVTLTVHRETGKAWMKLSYGFDLTRFGLL